MEKILVSIVIFLKEIDSTGLKVWVQKREEKGPLQGLWEFPGGKLKSSESSKEAAIREVLEEVGIDISSKPLGLLKLYETTYAKPVLLHCFICPFIDSEPIELAQKGRWLQLHYQDHDKQGPGSSTASLNGQIPPVNKEILDDLLAYFQNSTNRDNQELLWDFLAR